MYENDRQQKLNLKFGRKVAGWVKNNAIDHNIVHSFCIHWHKVSLL